MKLSASIDNLPSGHIILSVSCGSIVRKYLIDAGEAAKLQEEWKFGNDDMAMDLLENMSPLFAAVLLWIKDKIADGFSVSQVKTVLSSKVFTV